MARSLLKAKFNFTSSYFSLPSSIRPISSSIIPSKLQMDSPFSCAIRVLRSQAIFRVKTGYLFPPQYMWAFSQTQKNKLLYENQTPKALVDSQSAPCSFVELSYTKKRVGFIGLGNMGSRMANNLIKAGYNVAVHDINLSVIKMFSDKGISVKGSPLEVAEMSDVIITMLPSPTHVLDVYTGPNGLLNGGKPARPWLFIDSSTIDPQTTRKLSTAVSSCGLIKNKDSWETAVMLDAPVSGGVPAAETGTLTFMVGGPEDAYKAAEPLFSCMGKNTIYCGGAGTGSAAKICNNLAMAVSMLGVSEAFVLGQSLGITATTLTKIFNSSSARCWSSDTYNPVPGVIDGVPSSRNYDGGFASTLMAKDLSLASSSAKEIDLKCPLASAAEDIYTEICEKGHGTKDFSCVFRHFYSGKDEL